MVERLKYKLVGLGIVLLLCWMACSPPACQGAVIWADDFNDGTYEPEWTIVVNPNIHDGNYGFSGSSWSAANNYLQMLPSIDDWGEISHPSDVTVGTWSFDIQLNLTDFHPIGALVIINFLSNDVNDLNDESEINSYRVGCNIPFGTDAVWNLGKIINGAEIIIARGCPVPGTGWHHIDVTRNSTGLIKVYHNGALIIQAVDTDITISEVIWLYFQDMQMIDNIVVDDEVVVDDQDQPITCPPPWWLFVIGGSVAVIVVVIVVVIVFLRRRRRAQ